MLALPALVPPAEAGHKAPPIPELDWASCGPEFPGTECTIATVPLDYDRPGGATTQLVLARVPASDQANRIGTVFVSFGGPAPAWSSCWISGSATPSANNFGAASMS